jgi:hypothetical protein
MNFLPNVDTVDNQKNHQYREVCFLTSYPTICVNVPAHELGVLTCCVDVVASASSVISLGRGPRVTAPWTYAFHDWQNTKCERMLQ